MPRFTSLLLLFAIASSLGAQERRLNVVLIMADDVGYECFGAYGSKQYSTPRLDKLADTGVLFTQAHSKPLCTPSRVAIMTGKSNVRNYVEFGALSPDQFTFADLFRGAGYRTAIAGKWQLQGANGTPGVPAYRSGFHEYCLWHTDITARPRFWGPSIEINGALPPFGKDDYGPDIYSGFLIDFIKRNKDRPFFAYYPMALVHNPFLPTPDSKDRSSKDQQKNFEDMVAYMDKIVGSFADTIEDLGLRERTVLIFTADNGTHRRLSSTLKGRVIPGGKGTPADSGTHVPLIIWGAEEIRRGRVLNDLVELGDILPTIAEAAGLELPQREQFDGRSFWAQLKGEAGKPREWLYWYYFPRPYTPNPGPPGSNKETRFTRDQRFKLYADGRFYDLDADIEEKSPLAAGVAGESRKKLQAVLDSMPARGEKIRER